MSDVIKLDEIDIFYLEEAAPRSFPLKIEINAKQLKPLEEIIGDEE